MITGAPHSEDVRALSRRRTLIVRLQDRFQVDPGGAASRQSHADAGFELPASVFTAHGARRTGWRRWHGWDVILVVAWGAFFLGGFATVVTVYFTAAFGHTSVQRIAVTAGLLCAALLSIAATATAWSCALSSSRTATFAWSIVAAALAMLTVLAAVAWMASG